MTTTADRSAGALNIGDTLAYQTPDARFTVRLQFVRADAYTVVTERGTLRVAEFSKGFTTEDDARRFARDISKRLRDGATVAEVVAAIQPAAELITAATALLALAAAVDALSPAQQRAIRSADTAGRITRGQVATVKTLYALESQHLGRCTRRGFTITGFDLNARGLAMRDHLHTYTATIAA